MERRRPVARSDWRSSPPSSNSNRTYDAYFLPACPTLVIMGWALSSWQAMVAFPSRPTSIRRHPHQIPITPMALFSLPAILAEVYNAPMSTTMTPHSSCVPFWQCTFTPLVVYGECGLPSHVPMELAHPFFIRRFITHVLHHHGATCCLQPHAFHPSTLWQIAPLFMWR